MRAARPAICIVLAVALVSCAAHERPRTALGPPPILPEQRRAARPVPLPEWYWEPVDADLHADPKAVELPVPEATVVRVEGATRVWDELGAEGRDRLQRDGLLVVPGTEPARSHMGAFYMDLRARRVPYLVTLDALAYAVHLAFERALAEVDEVLLAPGLDKLLIKLEARLGAEQRGAGIELGEGLRLARAIVAVARGLSDGAAPPVDLSPDVAREIVRINAHAGPAPSVLLGCPIDYGRFAAPPGVARIGSFRAMTWLASAPLSLVAQSEARGAVVGVATARLHARAAMLLARVTDREVDPEIHAAWSTIARLLAFVWGPPDDLSPPELAGLASTIGISLQDPKHIANVVSVDRLRRRAARGRAPLVFDGAGAPRRPGIAVRIFGGHASDDSIALASLVDPSRPLPTTLGLAAWLAARANDAAPSRHASVHGSLLDVVMAWLAPRQALASPAAQRAAIDSALAAWTLARHSDQPLSRPRPVRAMRAVKELHVTGAPLPAFVEAAPEVIARLLGTTQQMRRGLAAIANLPAHSTAMTTLAEVEDMLRIALRASVREVNDESLEAEDMTALASLPARLARLEEAEEGGGATGPVVAEIFVDSAGDRSLSSATGPIEPVLAVVRDPGTGRVLLTTGAHLPHHEVIEPRGHVAR